MQQSTVMQQSICRIAQHASKSWLQSMAERIKIMLQQQDKFQEHAMLHAQEARVDYDAQLASGN